MSPTQHKIGGALLIAETRPIEARKDEATLGDLALLMLIIVLWMFAAYTSGDLIARDRK